MENRPPPLTPEQRKEDLLLSIGSAAAELYDAVVRWKEEPTDHRRLNMWESIGSMEGLLQILDVIRQSKPKGDSKMEQHRIHRDDSKDLVFRGEEIATASNAWVNGKDQTRWTELTLYRTEGGKFVLENEFFTRWQGESDRKSADVFDNVEELEQHFNGEISNLEYELIAEAKEKCPELDKLIVEVLE